MMVVVDLQTGERFVRSRVRVPLKRQKGVARRARLKILKRFISSVAVVCDRNRTLDTGRPTTMYD